MKLLRIILLCCYATLYATRMETPGQGLHPCKEQNNPSSRPRSYLREPWCGSPSTRIPVKKLSGINGCRDVGVHPTAWSRSEVSDCLPRGALVRRVRGGEDQESKGWYIWNGMLAFEHMHVQACVCTHVFLLSLCVCALKNDGRMRPLLTRGVHYFQFCSRIRMPTKGAFSYNIHTQTHTLYIHTTSLCTCG